MGKYLDKTGLKIVWGKLKAYLATSDHEGLLSSKMFIWLDGLFGTYGVVTGISVSASETTDTIIVTESKEGSIGGRGVSIPAATTTAAGVMTADDKKKLDAIDEEFVDEYLRERIRSVSSYDGKTVSSRYNDVHINANNFDICTGEEPAQGETSFTVNKRFTINPGGGVHITPNTKSLIKFGDDGEYIIANKASDTTLIGFKVGANGEVSLGTGFKENTTDPQNGIECANEEIYFKNENINIVKIAPSEVTVGNSQEKKDLSIKLRASSTNNITLKPTQNKIVGDTEFKDGTVSLNNVNCVVGSGSQVTVNKTGLFFVLWGDEPAGVYCIYLSGGKYSAFCVNGGTSPSGAEINTSDDFIGVTFSVNNASKDVFVRQIFC